MRSEAANTLLTVEEVSRYLKFGRYLAELGGRATLPYFRAAVDVENKGGAGDYDPVTIADRASEDAIRSEVSRVYPDHGVYGEERGRVAGTNGLTWVIDPIDGTRAFILGQLHWGVLIALNDGRRPVLGVMHQPFVGESFFGSAQGAFVHRGTEERRLRTRACADLNSAAVCASNPDQFELPQERAAFDLIASMARFYRYGGDCYNYCLLAAGTIDLVIESALHAYDVQALIPIVESAGGVMTDWRGGACYDGGAVVAAGDPQLHRRVLELLSWSKR